MTSSMIRAYATFLARSLVRLLDTNIFIYAVGREHSLKASCVALLDSASRDANAYTTDVEVLQELLYVYTLSGEREREITVVESIQIMFPNALPVTSADVGLAMDLMKHYLSVVPRDAIHAAIVFNHNLEGIVSTDRDFDSLPELMRFDP